MRCFLVFTLTQSIEISLQKELISLLNFLSSVKFQLFLEKFLQQHLQNPLKLQLILIMK